MLHTAANSAAHDYWSACVISIVIVSNNKNYLVSGGFRRMPKVASMPNGRICNRKEVCGARISIMHI